MDSELQRQVRYRGVGHFGRDHGVLTQEVCDEKKCRRALD
jgi:hypothetical protein